MPLRRRQLHTRQPHALPVPALLLLDLPQERGRQRICDQHHGRCGDAEGEQPPRLRVWHAPIDGGWGPAERHFCAKCGTPLWISDEQWPELVHPFASAIDTKLPKPPMTVHILLRDKADWVEPQIGPSDEVIRVTRAGRSEQWHKHRKLWID